MIDLLRIEKQKGYILKTDEIINSNNFRCFNCNKNLLGCDLYLCQSKGRYFCKDCEFEPKFFCEKFYYMKEGDDHTHFLIRGIEKLEVTNGQAKI